MIDYRTVFLKKIGMFHSDTPYTEDDIDGFLNEAAAVISRKYDNPWGSFEDVPEIQKYQVTVFAAIEYWWSKQSEYVDLGDVQIGASGNVLGLKAATKFDRATKMITALTEEYEELVDISEGPGDIIIGDLLRRNKQTGRLVPNKNDPNNWMS